MKVLVYTRPGELQQQEAPMPDLVPGEVVLKIEAVGICGSDMHAWHGHDPRRQPGLVLKPLRWPGLQRRIYLVRRRDRALSAAAQGLCNWVLAHRPQNDAPSRGRTR